MCFLSDVLFLVTNLQKTLQADDICITDLKPNLSVFIQKLSNLQDAPLLGGWEDTFLQQLAVEDGKTTLFEVVLWNKGRRTQSMHQYVTGKRDFNLFVIVIAIPGSLKPV